MVDRDLPYGDAKYPHPNPPPQAGGDKKTLPRKRFIPSPLAGEGQGGGVRGWLLSSKNTISGGSCGEKRGLAPKVLLRCLSPFFPNDRPIPCRSPSDLPLS
jgi:hypothetical protein